MTKKTSIIVVISVAIILISLILSIYIPNKDKIGEEIEDESIVYTVINENEKFWKNANFIGVTNRKLPAQLYIDDRAYKYTGQTVKQFIIDNSDKGDK